MTLFNEVRLRLRRMFSLDTSVLSSFLNFLIIFLDYPLPDSLLRQPPRGWTKSQIEWIAFTFSASVKKASSYLSSEEKVRLRIARRKEDHYKDRNSDPLVSVIIPTYNRSKILLSRSVPSVLNQTYKNIELIVVGDHCTDDTEKLMKSYPDPRLRFFNLPQRGNYPEVPLLRWCVAGVPPVNFGMKESKGEWLAHLDDDDEFSPNHLKSLLSFALKNDFEMVYGKVKNQDADGSWEELGSSYIELGNLCRSASLYRAYLKCFPYDNEAWKKGEPADFNLWRRMKRSGVRMGFLNAIVALHYQEKTRISEAENLKKES